MRALMLLLASLVLGAGPADAAALSLRSSDNLQKAIDALPAKGGTIRLAAGVYAGQIRIGKPDVQLIGMGARPEDVRIVASESAATQGSIYASATLHVAGDGFRARNLTIANDWDRRGKGASQAVALAVSGDRALFEQVRITGGQDTLYLARPPGRMTRQLFRDCTVEGHVDFIFGNAKAWFDRCTIHGVAHEKIIYTANSRNHASEDSAFVFHQCRFTADAAKEVWLGRPWRPYARVILIDSQVQPPLAPGGWREWKPGLTHDAKTAAFAEHGTTYAAGAPPQSKIKPLTQQQADDWALEKFFAGDTGWTR